MSDLIPAKNALPESERPATELLLADIRALIESAKSRVVVTANREQTLLYWDMGKRIRLKSDVHPTVSRFFRQCRKN